jgi:energy-coupling factor transport system permease protein
MNPTVKLLAVILSVLGLAWFFDPVTPLIYIAWILLLSRLFSQVPWWKWLAGLAPITFLAFGMFWTATVFSRFGADDPAVLWQWGWVTVTREGLMTGISLGLRMVGFAAVSLLFMLTTNPTQFIYSLMQQCKLPSSFAYGMLAAYRFLPLIREEWAILIKAHRVRGYGQAKGIREKMRKTARFAIPLLAGAIRKAERTALAMESKGFVGSNKRTYFYVHQVKPMDWVIFAIVVAGVPAAALISWQLGFLRMYHGQL